MVNEFEIKTGLNRKHREAYTLGKKSMIITLEGRYNYSNILQIDYVPPFLAGEEGQQLPDDLEAASQLASNDLEAASQLLARYLKNQDVYNGRGEPLYLTAESPDGKPLTTKQLQLHKAFQEELVVSVARNFGINNRELVLAARKHKDSGFERMDDGYNEVIAYLWAGEIRHELEALYRPSSMPKQVGLALAK
jgi:hypothetical protein